MEAITRIADVLRKIPAAFLVALLTVVAIILFLPEKQAEVLAIDEFREDFRTYLGPGFLLILSFCVARSFGYAQDKWKKKQRREIRQAYLHNLTPEEKGFLLPYIKDQATSVYVGPEDGTMASLRAKDITYMASSIGDSLTGFAFNLQPWARKYLEQNPNILDGYSGRPLTPREKLRSGW